MSYLAIVAWDGDNQVTKFQPYAEQAEAEAHVAEHGGFVVVAPAEDWPHWTVDPIAETISVVQKPDPPPTDDEIYDQIIQNQKVFRGYVLAINDGSIIPGSDMTGAAIKAAVKAKM